MDIIANLKREFRADLCSRAYLFVIGNREEAEDAIRYIIEREKCRAEDIIRIEPPEEEGKAGEIKVGDIRNFIHDLNLTPFGNVRLGIIYDLERLNAASANVLLKTLEEPPENALLILTSKTSNLLPTISSRCRIYKSSEKRAEDHTFSYQNILTDTLADAFKEVEKITKGNASEEFLSSFEKYFEKEMTNNICQRNETILEEILKTRKRIRNNANPRLALENLIMKARKI